ncbi:hypothetical protein CDV31_000202 [Fusarium ambrosium]|uniref:Uncharacterized protein n=1 Tax=Fusarium ambrosium TaxID=131363 RepID=A0A428V2S9_9HYPO|nr:hypothetical protein CDV31_000202 [Fusarium ambrosium]
MSYLHDSEFDFHFHRDHPFPSPPSILITGLGFHLLLSSPAYRPLSHHPKSGRSRASATRRRALPVAFVNLYTISNLRMFELVSSVRLFRYLIG